MYCYEVNVHGWCTRENDGCRIDILVVVSMYEWEEWLGVREENDLFN